jgi:hypothetical protein
MLAALSSKVTDRTVNDTNRPATMFKICPATGRLWLESQIKSIESCELAGMVAH